MTKFDYRTDWQAYTYPETNMISTPSDIREVFTRVDLSSKKLVSGGIPLLAENDTVYLNSSDENTIIFGETGSKKTRSVILPLIATTAGAHESAFITDVKGELSANPKIQGYMKEHGVKGIYLDFRTFGGDGYNIFEQPFRLSRNGQKDKAGAMVMRLVDTFGKRFVERTNDLFWETSAAQLLLPLILLLFELCGRKESRFDMVNMLTVNSYMNMKAAQKLLDIIESGELGDPDSDNRLIMLRTVLNNPDRTLSCILSTAQSMIHEFTIQRDLLCMLSESTFDLSEMYDRPTFVFLIVPDETSAYDTISGMLIDMFYSGLIDAYSEKFQGKKEPACRINYICDEFCNLHINDMRAKISASRSRNMRWFLVCQSKQQMDAAYKEDAGTIIGNCKNVLFLKSSDPEMLGYMSELCGNTHICRPGITEALVTREMLKGLRKETEYKEALFIRDDIRYFAKLTDIDHYEFLLRYGSEEIFRFKRKFEDRLKVFSVNMLLDAAKQTAKEQKEAENKEKQKKEAEEKQKKEKDVPTRRLTQADIEAMLDSGNFGPPDEKNIREEFDREYNKLFGAADEDSDDDDP